MAMEGASNRRLRLNFQDRTVLTKTQKKLGLKRSWFLLKPQHHTVNDVVLHIVDAFNLRQSCPNGIVLTMDGFVLPPFESTIILKDEDVVSVKRKVLSTKAIAEERPFIEDEIVEKQLLPSGIKLLANMEFDQENGGCESQTDVGEVEADVPSKKRKASCPIESSKKKKQRQVMSKSVQKKDINDRENNKTLQKKRKLGSGSNGEVTVKCTNNSEPRSNGLVETQEVAPLASGMPNRSKEAIRRCRRKSLKRYLKKLGVSKTSNNKEKDEKHDNKNKLDKVSGFEKSVDSNIRKLTEEDSEAEDDLVPVEIRPGHIRFASASEVKEVLEGREENGWDVQEKQEANGWIVQKTQQENGQDVRSTQKSAWGDHSAQKNVYDANKNKVAKEKFCWNGITNKRKGQKWGTESRDYNDQSSSTRVVKNKSTSFWKHPREYNNQSSNTRGSREKKPDTPAMDFEKLMPLTDSPKVGDVIAYRLLELSSSWCPELSSFRVGKITSYDKETNNIVLVPEAEFPLNLEKKTGNDHDDDDASEEPPQPSLYKEDGSLEIDFTSLVEVRIVKSNDPNQLGSSGVPATNDTPGSSGISKDANQIKDATMNSPLDTGNQESHTSTTPANGKKDVWEEISEALSAKKAQLQQENNWNKKESPAKRTWSRRTLKSSALGPTMAMLRSQNGALNINNS